MSLEKVRSSVDKKRKSISKEPVSRDYAGQKKLLDYQIKAKLSLNQEVQPSL